MPHLQGVRADGPQIIDFVAEQTARQDRARAQRIDREITGIAAELKILHERIDHMDDHLVAVLMNSRASVKGGA